MYYGVVWLSETGLQGYVSFNKLIDLYLRAYMLWSEKPDMLMNTITSVDAATIYELTTIILGVTSLIMGVTLITLRSALKNSGTRSKAALLFLAVAMLALGVINLLEYTTGVDSQKERYSLSIVVFAASVELFLIFMAYMSMLCKEFATRRRIYFEIGYIILFTTPAIFATPDNNPILFNVLFGVGIAFYCAKFLCNYIEYRKQMTKTKKRVESLLSDDSSVWLKWINNTFYVVLVIGLVSVIAPMTNLMVLVFYNSFLLFAYLYVYISVIRKISIFDKSMAMLERDEVADSDNEQVEEPSFQTNVFPKPAVDFMDARHKLINDWIANRGYAVAGVTATEVAAHLRTNRTKLSYYLKNTLNTTYYDWIARLRVEDAKRQLIEYPDKAIYEIALDVGIEDRANFRHMFQKIVGVSPTAYRKQVGNEK